LSDSGVNPGLAKQKGDAPMDDVSLDRAEAAKAGSPFLSTKQAAFYLGVSIALLEKMRSARGSRSKRAGPRFRRHGGSVLYHIDDLDRWSESGA
jgi:hypothetical protein